MRRLLLAAALLLPACTGFMQASLPDRAQSFCRQQRVSSLRIGFGEADITPSMEVWLAGFGLARAAEGQHAPLKARAMVVLDGDGGPDGFRAVVVGIDNLGLQRQDADWIKGGVHGFRLGEVFLCSSHTHSAPDLVGMWGWYMLSSGRDRDYVRQVRQGVALAVERAVAAARPARLRLGDAQLPPEGLVKNANRRGVFDRRLTVLFATDRETQQPLGALIHLACHPEVLGRRNTLLSPDFVGPMCDEWRRRGLGQAVFVNGALGAMISPDVKPRDPEGVEAMGTRLCDLARQAMEGAAALPVADAEIRRRDVYLPMDSLGLVFGRQVGVIPRPTHRGLLRSTVGYLRLGDLEVACVPGEMEPALAARLRRSSGRPRMLLFGLVDDEVGYLISRRDADDPLFAYERTMSPGPDAGEQVLRALVDR